MAINWKPSGLEMAVDTVGRGRKDLDPVLGRRFAGPGHRSDDEVREQIRRALAGEDPEATAACLDAVTLRITPVDVYVLRALGLDPAVAVLIAQALGSAWLEGPQGGADLFPSGGSITLHATLAEDAVWHSGDMGAALTTAPLPETVVTAIASRRKTGGTPLREVLSHAALDPFPLVVLHAVLDDGKTLLDVADAACTTPGSAREIIAGAAPAG